MKSRTRIIRYLIASNRSQIIDNAVATIDYLVVVCNGAARIVVDVSGMSVKYYAIVVYYIIIVQGVPVCYDTTWIIGYRTSRIVCYDAMVIVYGMKVSYGSTRVVSYSAVTIIFYIALVTKGTGVD